MGSMNSSFKTAHHINGASYNSPCLATSVADQSP